MVVPEAEQGLQQVGPAQERAVGGLGRAQHDVVAAAGADVAAVEHELLGRQADLARFFVKFLAVLHELVPACGGMDVDLDHAGVGGDGEMVQPRIVRRQVAFQHDLAAGLGGGVLHRGEQVS